MTNELTTTTRPEDLDLFDRSAINQNRVGVKVMQDVGFLVLPVCIGRSVRVSEATGIG